MNRKNKKHNCINSIYLILVCCLNFGFVDAQNPLDRPLPSDSYFFNPTINSNNQRTFPDGNTSTSALQEMINSLSASGGGILNINAGTYTFQELTVKSNVHFRVHPDVVIKSDPRRAIFRVGFNDAEPEVVNWSFETTTGEKMVFDFTGLNPNDGIRAFQLSNTSNFKISDFQVLDNNTKFNAITTSPTGTNGVLHYPHHGIIENLDTKSSHYGYGMIQCQIGRDLLFRDISGEGGSTLRLESGVQTLAERLDPETIIHRVYGRNISARNGAAAVMMSPHTIVQGWVDVRGISGSSCEGVVALSAGFLSSKKGQTEEGGYVKGTFSNESVLADISATYGVNAQVRATRLRFVPCALRGYISEEKNIDEESYKSPSLAPVYNLAVDNLGAAGTYNVVIHNVSFTGFSAEYPENGILADASQNDFEGCDIDAYVPRDDKNTTNPRQTSTEAEALFVGKTAENKVKIYMNEQQNLHVENAQGMNFELLNLNGKKLLSSKIHSNIEIINTFGLTHGVYILRLTDANRNVSLKFIL